MVGPCPGRCPTGQEKQVRSRRTSGSDKTHPLTSTLKRTHTSNKICHIFSKTLLQAFFTLTIIFFKFAHYYMVYSLHVFNMKNGYFGISALFQHYFSSKRLQSYEGPIFVLYIFFKAGVKHLRWEMLFNFWYKTQLVLKHFSDQLQYQFGLCLACVHL